MAYGLIYTAKFRDIRGVAGVTEIYKDDYTGDSTELKTTDLRISYNDDENIISTGASLTIINTFADWKELDDLLGNYEKQYKGKIIKNGETLFEGYLICDLNEQDFNHQPVVRLNFTNYIRRLKDEYIITDNETITLLSLIQTCLTKTGNLYDICVNTSIYHEDTTGNFLMNTKVSTDVFFRNELQTLNAYDILQSILKSFDAYLYTYKDKYYIERYNDIDNTGDWIVYTITGTTSSVLSNKKQALNKQDDFHYLNGSQVLQYNSGANTLEINLEDKRYNNLTDITFTNFIDGGALNNIDVNNRGWKYSTGTATNASTTILKINGNHLGINNPINLSITSDHSWSHYLSYETNTSFLTWGVYTNFKITVEDEYTELKINWKHINRLLNNISHVNVNTKGFYHYYYLRLITTDPLYKTYIVYDEVDEEWKTQISNAASAVQKVYRSSDQVNQDTAEDLIEANIKIGDIEALRGTDVSIVLGIFYPTADWQGSGPGEILLTRSTIGDVIITVDGTKMDNFYSSTINENFIKVEKMDLKLFDAPNLNYANGLMYEDSFGRDTRTHQWTEDGVAYNTLIEYIIKSRFNRLYKTTKNLKARIFYTGFIKPLCIVTDDNLSSMEFIVHDYTYDVLDNRFAINMSEYTKETFTLNYP